MYEYRKLTPEQQKAVVEERVGRGYPWHKPPHPEAAKQYRIISAACYEHIPHLNSSELLSWFEKELLDMLKDNGYRCAAWCVLPNHYHALVEIADFKAFNKLIGKLHGGTSYELNRQENARGRKVWFKCSDRVMRSEGHFWTSVNYIHHNPVKHGYVRKWQEWPYSSAHWYLLTKGRDWLLEKWRDYPLKGYGDKWDTF